MSSIHFWFWRYQRTVFSIPSSNCRLGCQPSSSLSLREGIEKTVRWYLQNQSWMDDITSGEYQQYYQSMYKER